MKKRNIPFVLFISTAFVGKKGYMSWAQIKEVESEKFAFIGHHSHTHDYLIDDTNDVFISDIEKANKISSVIGIVGLFNLFIDCLNIIDIGS